MTVSTNAPSFERWRRNTYLMSNIWRPVGESRNDLRIDHEGRYARSFKNYLRYESDGTKSYYMHLSPRFFIFAYRGHAKPKSFEKHFDAATKRCADAHVHGACLLGRTGGGFYTGHFAYRKVGERVAPVVSRDGFREFLFFAPQNTRHHAATDTPPFGERLRHDRSKTILNYGAGYRIRAAKTS